MTSQDPIRFDNDPTEPDPGASGLEEPSDDLLAGLWSSSLAYPL